MSASREIATDLPLRPSLVQNQAEDQAIAACYDWLSFHRLWGELKAETLWSLARSLQLLKVESGTEIYRDDQAPVGLYLLKWGSVEIYRLSPVGKTHMLYRSAGETFGYVPLINGQGNARYQASAITLTTSEIWFLAQADFETLIETDPAIQNIFNRLLSQDVIHFAERVTREQARIQGLQPYIHPVPTTELIGDSKASTKLAQQIELAAADLKPVVFQGGSGTGKTFLAGFIHGHSGLENHPFAELDCAQLPYTEATGVDTTALFGQAERSLSVMELLERGTLLLDNVQRLSGPDRDRIIQYLNTGTLRPNPNPETRTAPAPVKSWVRLILASPTQLSLPEVATHSIKLFSLPQRKGDIPAFTQHFLAQFCREQGRPPLQVDQANTRRLISYDYPGNLGELAGILKRAVAMTPAGQTVIPEQTLWSVQSPKNAFRIDLLNQFPWLRRFLLSQWWSERFWIVVMVLFVPVTLMGYIGPQAREASMTLNFFWAWWWPFYLFLFVFVGRIWCAVCPFMITGEWIRKISLWIWPRDLLPWPTKWMNRWGAWVLFAGFVAIYLWEELWDLPHTAYLSAWLLIIITAGAVIGSVIYERRLWCRYLCPIGGMNGMFAKLSMIEVRSTQQVCGSQCSTFGCYKGSDATPVNFTPALPTEGQATGGCPLYSHPAQLQDNRDCILCMTCLKACPHRSVQLNLRFPASDLLENHQGNWPEVALLLLLLGGVFMHHDRQILAWVGWGDLPISSEHLLTGTLVTSLLLSIPAVLTGLTHVMARLFDRELPNYKVVIYAYLLTVRSFLSEVVTLG
ncbi:MAG: sigma 54-interacting transcriptional regulator [Thermosynechococcaceae cyanobacterium]